MQIKTLYKTFHIKGYIRPSTNAHMHPISKHIQHMLLILSAICCQEKNPSIKSEACFTTSTANINLPFNATDLIDITIPIKIIGQPFNEDITFNYNTNNEEIIQNKTRQFIFKKDSFATVLNLKCNIKSIEPGENRLISIKITDSNKWARNYNNTSIIISKKNFRNSVIGIYHCTDKLYHNNYPISIKTNEINDSAFAITNFWDFASNSSLIYIQFYPSKDSVSLNADNWTDKSQRTFNIIGSGSYSSELDINIHYTMYILPEKTIYEKGEQFYKKE